MIKCLNCKSCMIPKSKNIEWGKSICINPNQRKGLVSLNYECKYGEKL